MNETLVRSDVEISTRVALSRLVMSVQEGDGFRKLAECVPMRFIVTARVNITNDGSLCERARDDFDR